MKARWYKHRLQFKETAITSRERLDYKTTYIIELWDEKNPEAKGVGEIALFESLSKEAGPGFEPRLDEVVARINRGEQTAEIQESSIIFGMETAMASLAAGGGQELWPSAFTRGEMPIRINGLVWMGDYRQMKERIKKKLDEGFGCVKLKIGGIGFDDEVELLRLIRRDYGRRDLELRLDANGSFTSDNALERLGRLSEYDIHSLEQPIKAGQAEEMRRIVEKSPIAIALDEELIGTRSRDEKTALLEVIEPAYIVLKPSLAGGLAHSKEWIDIAKEHGTGWWITSALESNIGLNALAQFVALQNPTMPQGLGTGELYVENFPSPLRREGENLWYGLPG